MADSNESLPLRSLLEVQDDEAAAHVALLALRTGLPPGMGPHDDFLVPPDRRLVAAAEAVERLRALPKPVTCGAEPRGDVLVLYCQSLAGESRRLLLPVAGQMEKIYQQFQASRVLFVGVDQALLTTTRAAMRLHRDYHLPVNTVGDAPGSEWAEHQGLVALGTRAGAGFVHLFYETA